MCYAKSKHNRQIAIAIVVRDGRLLVNRRQSKDELQGLWEFPGGKMKPGELPAEAAIRECAEEVGIVVRAIGALPAVGHAYRQDTVTLHPVLCDHVSGFAKSSDPAIGEVRWVTPQELSVLAMPPANQPIVESLLKQLA